MTSAQPRRASREAALALLDELHAERVEHLGSDLRSHLLGTEAILRRWGAPETLACAGLCHALYGTDGFAPFLLELSERERAREALGEAAEHAVYQYAACARSELYRQLGQPQITLVDRFNGERQPLSADELGAFVWITAANELELVLRGVFDAATIAKIRGLFVRLRVYAPLPIDLALGELPS
jgi:hypothetical protein